MEAGRHMSDEHQLPQQREPYRFGPLALFARFRRWHAIAPLWQVLLLTLVLLVLIALTWGNAVGRW